jgi:CheY-like chemotaxis protein
MVTKPKTILVVEDNYSQRTALCKLLQKIVPTYHVAQFQTESDFCDFLQENDCSDVALAILDMMIPWQLPSKLMKDPPPEVLQTGYQQGGYRCAQRLAESMSPRQKVPTIIFSIIGNVSNLPLPNGCEWLIKSESHDELTDRIRVQLGSARS